LLLPKNVIDIINKGLLALKKQNVIFKVFICFQKLNEIMNSLCHLKLFQFQNTLNHHLNISITNDKKRYLLEFLFVWFMPVLY
jgi:hypothetical protein